MTRWMLIGLSLAALTPLGSAAEPAAKSSPWVTDYAAARATARKTGKPLLVVFR